MKASSQKYDLHKSVPGLGTRVAIILVIASDLSAILQSVRLLFAEALKVVGSSRRRAVGNILSV